MLDFMIWVTALVSLIGVGVLARALAALIKYLNRRSHR